MPDHSATILDWHTGGKVFLEYINICHAMKQLSQVHTQAAGGGRAKMGKISG